MFVKSNGGNSVALLIISLETFGKERVRTQQAARRDIAHGLIAAMDNQDKHPCPEAGSDFLKLVWKMMSR